MQGIFSKSYFISLVCLFTACRQAKVSDECRLVICMQKTSLDSLRIFRIGYLDSADKEIYHGVLYGPKDSAVFRLPLRDDRLYEIRFQYSGRRHFFVADRPDLAIRADLKKENWEIRPVSATSSIQHLLTGQQNVADSINTIRRLMDSVKQRSCCVPLQDSLRALIDKLDSFAQTAVAVFCDTVHNPAAFILGYSLYHPHDPYISARAMIRSGLVRFPGWAMLKKIDSGINAIAGIYEGEWKIGDSLPAFEARDLDGYSVPSSRWRGKPCLINLWAPWASGTYRFIAAQKRLRQQLKRAAPELVSIAFDDDPAECGRIVRATGADWTQLVDTAMWQGPVARALKNDSLPYNFLLSAEGKILDKAIPADSLHQRVERALGRNRRVPKSDF